MEVLAHMAIHTVLPTHTVPITRMALTILMEVVMATLTALTMVVTTHTQG
jgi:hypothetical protein